MTLRRQMEIARFNVRHNGRGEFEQMAPGPEKLYARETDAELDVLAAVDHAFLDKAREGLPMESGLAAKFWLQAIRVLKEVK